MSSIQQQMTQLADNAAVRYGLFLDALKVIYGKALTGAKLDQETIRAAKNEAFEILVNYIQVESSNIVEDIDAIASEASVTTFDELGVALPEDLSAPVSDLAQAIDEYLLQEIRLQAHRDVAFLEEGLRRTLLQVSVAARSSGLSPRAALIQYMIGNAQELNFFFHDRRGAKWSSQKFIRGVYRHGLLTVYNEAVLLTLADHGVEFAQIEHASVKSTEHGQIVAMSPNGEHPIYSEIRGEIFHPNSDAILRKAD